MKKGNVVSFVYNYYAVSFRPTVFSRTFDSFYGQNYTHTTAVLWCIDIALDGPLSNFPEREHRLHGARLRTIVSPVHTTDRKKYVVVPAGL